MILENIIMAINPVFLWFIFVIFFITLGLVLFYLLYRKSKDPEEWIHRDISSQNQDKSTLKKFAESIRYQTMEYDYNTSLEEIIQMMFFKKIETSKGVSADELYEIKNTNPQMLQSIIRDEEIYEWIIKSEYKNIKNSFFSRKKMSDEGEYIKEINRIIDKMEAWV